MHHLQWQLLDQLQMIGNGYTYNQICVAVYKYYHSEDIIVYADRKAEENYLSLDELGIVLGKISQQLPGIHIVQSLEIRV